MELLIEELDTGQVGVATAGSNEDLDVPTGSAWIPVYIVMRHYEYEENGYECEEGSQVVRAVANKAAAVKFRDACTEELRRLEALNKLGPYKDHTHKYDQLTYDADEQVHYTVETTRLFTGSGLGGDYDA